MHLIHRKESIILFIGDIIVFITSLFITLIIRYRVFPSTEIIKSHLAPFSILFIVFILVNFIAGLYEKHTLIFKNRLPSILLNVQLINAVIGIAFFYFIPYYSITPKTVLFIYVVLSLILMSLWRVFIAPKLGPKRSQKALLIGDTKETEELFEEINNNSRYHLSFLKIIIPNDNNEEISREIINYIKENKISVVVLDTKNKNLINVIPSLYSLALSGILFFDISKIYESIFDRIPPSLIGQTWFIEHVSSMSSQPIYDSVKRILDIIISLIGLLLSLLFYPFIIIALKIEDERNVLFTYQPRIGQNNKIINIIKFRTMKIANDNGNVSGTGNYVTKIGSFLRKTRLDEIPQFWNIFKGDLSLVGPRPEIPKYVDKYSNEISNYMIRHSVKPGVFGWAQIYHEKHPHHGIDITETENKLSYDLYYIKHRSLLLDIKIILRSIKVLLSFVGR